MIAILAVTMSATLFAEEVPVKYQEGRERGFLVLSTMNGKILAHGDSVQVAHGDHITLHLRFDFKDGSVQDETTIYSQGERFRVLNYHLIQKGPSFPHPQEVSIDCTTGEVNVHFSDKGGDDKTENVHLDLPADLANGIVPTLLKNLPPDSPGVTVSFLGAAPKPRVVKLVITPQGDDSFSAGGSHRKAIRYSVKVDVGGVAGLVAPLVGKQPADTHVWVWPRSSGIGTKSEH